MKKYELTNALLAVDTRTLHRIRALRSFGDVREGELGGWVESEKNLSHRGNCWVYHEAWVYDNARVTENARVYDRARIWGKAKVCGNARIWGRAKVYGNARVCEEARVCRNARVYGNARIYESALVCGEARVYGSAKVYGNAQVVGYSCLSGDTILKISEYIWFSDIKLDHGTWEDVIKINDKKYLVSNMLDLYEIPG